MEYRVVAARRGGAGNVRGGIGGASRGAGVNRSMFVIGSPEGVAVRSRRPMLARCWFRVAIVAAVIISRDCGESCEFPSGKWFSWAIGAPRVGRASGERCGGSFLRVPRGRAFRTGEGRREAEGVGGVENAWCYLPRWSCVPVRFSARVRSSVAVRGKCRHHALGLPSPAGGFFAVARLARLDGPVAGGGVDLDSADPGTAFAGLLDGDREPFRGVPSAVHLLYQLAQLDEPVSDVDRKG